MRTQVKERGLRGKHPWQHLDLGLPTSRTVRKNDVVEATQAAVFYYEPEQINSGVEEVAKQSEAAFDFKYKSYKWCKLQAQGCTHKVSAGKYLLTTDWLADRAEGAETAPQTQASAPPTALAFISLLTHLGNCSCRQLQL